MTTVLLRQVADFAPKRIGVRLLPLVHRRPPLATGLSLDVHARRIILERSLRALKPVMSSVRARIGDIVLQHHRLSLGRLEDGRVMITGHVSLTPLRIALVGHCRVAPQVEPALRSADGDEVLVPVAAVDVEIPGHRAESVRGIQVCVRAGVPCASPESLVAILEQDLAQVVEVRRLRVQHIAEHPSVDHPVHEHLGFAVVAVLEMQAVAPRLLRRVHERPQILERRADRTLAPAVLSRRQRGEHHRNVPLPRRRRIHKVHIIPLHEGFEPAIATRVAGRRNLAGVGDHLRRARDLVGYHVRERHDFHVVQREELTQHRLASKPRPDDSDAHGLVALERDPFHRHARGRRWRREVGMPGRRHFLGDGRHEHTVHDQPRASDSGALEKIAPGYFAHSDSLGCDMADHTRSIGKTTPALTSSRMATLS